LAPLLWVLTPSAEGNISTLSATISEGRYLEPSDEGTIVIGDGLARNLKLKVGDGVVMLGSGTDGSVAADVLTLVGIFRSGVPELDRQIAQMPLTRFQETFALSGDVNTIALKGSNLADVVRVDAELRNIATENGVLYRSWEELQPAIKQMIQLDMSTSGMMYVTLVTVVVFIILNTLYMSVLERTREFGGLMALGMRPRLIGKMVWMELIFLSFLGAGIGIALGSALTIYFLNVGIYIPGMEEIYAQWGIPSRMYPSFTIFSVLGRTDGNCRVDLCAWFYPLSPDIGAGTCHRNGFSMMNNFKILRPLAWRNLWRNPRRTSITLIVVVVGLWSVLTFASLLAAWGSSSRDAALGLLIGQGQIHASGYMDDPNIENLMPPLTGH